MFLFFIFHVNIVMV